MPCTCPAAASLPPTPCTQALQGVAVDVQRCAGVRAAGPWGSSGASSDPAVGQGQGPLSEVQGPCLRWWLVGG